MAQSIDAVLHVVHVLPLSFNTIGRDLPHLLQRAIERHVANNVRTVQLFCEGDPVREIANAARALDSDLIVMAARSQAQGAKEGGMPLEVAKLVQCPVYGLNTGMNANSSSISFVCFMQRHICLN